MNKIGLAAIRFVIKGTMKPSLLVAIFLMILLPGGIYAQFKFEVEIDRCLNEYSDDYLAVFYIYKGDSLQEQVSARCSNHYKFNYGEAGKYNLRYQTIYGENRQIDFELKPKSKPLVKVCTDIIAYDNFTGKTFIEDLQDGESFYIVYQSSGCFHHRDDTFEITRANGQHIMRIRNIEKSLAVEQLKELRIWEIELNAIRGGFCTTRDSFTLVSKRDELSVTDRSCAWSGGLRLKKILGLENY